MQDTGSDFNTMTSSQHADTVAKNSITQTDLPPDTHIAFSDLPAGINQVLVDGFLEHQHDDDVKRTHLFNGRYENIYLSPVQIPGFERLITEACSHASRILGVENLQPGYWFNHMPPGAVTTVHSHDDDDELLSAVYYVMVPENTGNLVIHNDKQQHVITPREGMFVFFAPDVVHEVSENLSTRDRLSIGFNFGRRRNAD